MNLRLTSTRSKITLSLLLLSVVAGCATTQPSPMTFQVILNDIPNSDLNNGPTICTVSAPHVQGTCFSVGYAVKKF